MTNVSGRISSAQLLKSRRASSAQKKKNVKSIANAAEAIIEINEEEDKEVKNADEAEEEEEKIFQLLTPQSIITKHLDIENRKERIKQKNRTRTSIATTEGKLVDGKIIYEGSEEFTQDGLDDHHLDVDPTLVDGNQIPPRLGKVPADMLQVPLEEIDPYIKIREETFIMIGKRINKYYLYRFSSTKAFYVLSPFHPLRKAFLFLSTWQFFDWFMILTILANCIILAVSLDESQQNVTEYLFTAIYTIEFVVKVIANGFILKPFTYLRDPWNWLDFLLILLSYIGIIIDNASTSAGVNLSSLRAFRVFRAFKTVNIIPGLKTIVSAILKSLVMFMEVLVLMLLALTVFSLFSLQAYQGAFSQKCVKTFDPNNATVNYTEWTQDEDNWQYDTSIAEYAMCCNGTTTNEGRVCDTGYVCLRDIGQNPNYGITHYDNFGFALLQNFQVMSLDHWEDVYHRVTDTMGPWNIFYFLPIVFMGSFYLVNLMLAVVSLAYNMESEYEKKKFDYVPPKKKDAVYDLNTLKEKIAMVEQKRLEALKRKQEKNRLKGITDELEANSNLDRLVKSPISGFKETLGGSFDIDDNKTAQLTTIKLSENMGKYNNLIQEGKKSCHYHGDDLVVDKRNCYCCITTGEHYLKWVKIQNFFLKICKSFQFELFIAFCIIVNTVVMSVQYYGQPQSIDDLQNYTNYIVSSIFILESIFKIIAFGKLFFFELQNWFDLFIIAMSIVDFSVPSINGLSVFRTFRLMRIFKLAKSWKTMRRILVIIGHSVASLSYLSLVLFIVIYVFALIGLNLFSESYNTYYSTEEMPRSNFVGIAQSLLVIFRILCGECIEPLIDCWRAAGPSCVALYYPTVVFGNFLILNLFMAMLLDAFDSSTIKNAEDEEEDQLSREINNLKEKISKKVDDFKLWFKQKTEASVTPDDAKEKANENQTTKKDGDGDYIKMESESSDSKSEKSNGFTSNSTPTIASPTAIDTTNEAADTEEEAEAKAEKKLVDCFPEFCYAKICHFSTKETKFNNFWTKLRTLFLKLIANKIFEAFIMISIFASSLLLAFEDVYLKSDSLTSTILQDLDYAFQVVFLLEMLIKWVGYGFKKYFTDWWCILDFIIVMVSIINLGFVLSTTATEISFLKVLRTLRAFRPLRAISRWQGMKVVINALGQSIPAIFDVLVVCMVFWLIFSIMGVTLFKGKFFKCVDKETGFTVENVTTKNDCLSLNTSIWYNKKVNFDNVALGYLSLYQLATFEGWRELIEAGTDAVDVDMQPKRESNMWMHLYFVVFIIFGSFFTLNLFVGVIIDNFNTLKKKHEGGVLEMFLTPSQAAYIKTIKSMTKSKPQKSLKRPTNPARAFIYDIVTSTKFQVIISAVVMLNLVAMGFEYYHQPDYYENIFNIVSTVFTTIFGLEVMFKLIALKQHFFLSVWNVYELLVAIICLIAAPFEFYVEKFMVKPLIFYVVRILRLIRMLRFFKAAKGMRKLIFALIISLPALFNVAALLFLIIFIYSIIGMNFFMNVQLQRGFTPNVNFQTFGKSFMLLFRVGTISGWNDVLEALMLTTSDPGPVCDENYDLQKLPSSVDPKTANGCGNTGVAIFFMVTYVLIVRMVMINMYIAVILENYEMAHEQEEIGVTEDDYEHFYSVWENYDQHATQFIRLEQLSDLVGDLGPPLGVDKPNEMAITAFNLPIIKGDLVHCLDVLHALATYALGNVESSKEFTFLLKQLDEQFATFFPLRVNHVPYTTTMERKKLEIAARTLQRAWRRFVKQRSVLRQAQTIIQADQQHRKSIILDPNVLKQVKSSVKID